MISLEQIMDYLDWKITFYDGDARKALVAACDVIYDFVHKDDPDEPHGN